MSKMFVKYGESLISPVNPNGLGVELFLAISKHQIQESNIALIDAKTKEHKTYRELLQSSVQLAQALAQECQRDRFIGVYSENHLNYFQAILAAIFIGIPLAPINFQYQGNELVHALSIAKPTIVFTSTTVLVKLLKVLPNCPWIRKIILIDCSHLNENINGLTTINQFMESHRDTREFTPIPVDVENHPLVVLCSSGTTGMPKGVVLTHQNILGRVIQMQDPRFVDFKASDVELCLLPFFHGFGFVAMIGFLYRASKIVIMSKFEVRTLLQSIQDYKIRFLYLVPPIIVTLLKSDATKEYNLTSLQTIYCGAAPLDKKIEILVREKLGCSHIFQGYGLTEATQATLLHPIPRRGDKSGSVGKVLPGMQALILDLESGEAMGANQRGELCLKGCTVMKGYLNNPTATAETFTKDGWLRTGDIAYYDDDEYFYIVDRRKELIKYKSFQVAPAELEAILLSHPNIQDAAVIGIPDLEAGELPLAFVVLLPGCEMSAPEVKMYIEERVSSTKWLRGGVRFVQAIPRNASGKITRQVLRDSIKQEMCKL